MSNLARLLSTAAVGLTVVSTLALLNGQPQPIVGLSEYGLLLSGTPSQPLLVNQSGRRVIAYTVLFKVIRDGRPYTISRSVSALLNIRNRFFMADTTSVLTGSQRVVAMNGQPADKVQSVSLDAAIFEDGEVVGPDVSHTGDRIAAQIAAERDLAETVLSGAAGKDRSVLWAMVRRAAGDENSETVVTPRIREQVAPQGKKPFRPLDMKLYTRTYGEHRKEFAEELSGIQQKAGEEMATRIAAQASAYPELWTRH